MKHYKLFFTILLGCFLSIGMLNGSYAQQFAYVTSSGSNNVSVIDVSTNTVATTVPLGLTSYLIAITPDGSKAYALSYPNSVSVIDVSTNTLATIIPVGSNPLGIAITPDGSQVYVMNYNDGTASVIDVSSNTVTTTIPVGSNPFDMAITPDGSRAYVTNNSSNTVSVIDVSTNTVTTTIPVGSIPRGIAITPDGSWAYVANIGGGNISVIDLSNNTVTATVTVGAGPARLTITPDGSEAWVVNVFGNNISVIDVSSNTVVSTVTPGITPQQVAFTQDGSQAYVTNNSVSTVSVIDVSSGTVTATVSVGLWPIGIAITPVVSSGSYDIYTVNTKTGDVERVTFIDDADEYNPSFNNNGKLVAHDVKSSSDPLGQSVYITDLKTHTSTPLIGAEGGNDPSWSPNGKYIAFDRDGNIYVVPSDGGTATFVREGAIDAEWSNNSKRLVFQDVTDNSVRTIDVSSGSETIVAAFGFNPSWSPNGKYIAYSEGNNIFKIKVNQLGESQGSPVQLSNDGAGVFNSQPSWSNNSKTIVFHSNRVSGDFDIWTVSASGGTPELLTGDPGYGDYDPCYSKNGKYVAYDGFTIASSSPSKSGFDSGESLYNNESSIPTEYSLDQNYPNPFNPRTQIRFGIPEASKVKVEVFSITGELVTTLVDGFESEGYHTVSFNASGLSSGMYLYRISAGTFIETKKMILLR